MTTYYMQTFDHTASKGAAFWSVKDRTGQRIDTVCSETLCVHSDSEEALEAIFEGSKFHRLLLPPGEYFPYMARPIGTSEDSPGYSLGRHDPTRRQAMQIAQAGSEGQLHHLIEGMAQICRVVHPTPENFKAFGHAIRDLLISACTEVEAQWKKILEENGYKPPKKRKNLNTSDYIKLSCPLKLAEYSVELPYYPWLKPIAPFKSWENITDSPSQVLRWYDAYNNVKHNREKHLDQATLKHALYAVTGCFVMLCAQYGWDFARRGDAASRKFFKLNDTPRWKPSEIYIRPFGENSPYRPRNYDFNSLGPAG